MDPTIRTDVAERYDHVTADLITSRMRWLTPVLAALMLLGGIPQAFDPHLPEGRFAIVMGIRVLSAAGLAVIWVLCTRLRGLNTLRILSYVFAILGFATVATIQSTSRPLRIGPSIYIVLTYVMCFIVPWRVRDTLLLAAAGFAAYTVEAWKVGDVQNREPYAIGTLFFIMGALLAVIMKRDDERRRLHEFLLQTEVEEHKAELERDLDLARRVHLSVIPKSVVMDEAEVAVTYAPMSYMGGDYANFLMAKDGRLIFFMSDVTGHGVPAALVANRIHSEVERLMKESIGPGELLHRLDMFVTEQLRGTSMFLSAVSGVVDFHRKELVYSNHGHPPQILYESREGTLRLLEPRSPILGVGIPGPPPEESEADLPLNAGDRIILFTDGVTETQGKEEELFGLERLKAFVAEHGPLPPEQFNAALTNELNAFRVGPTDDDIFILTIRVR